MLNYTRDRRYLQEKNNIFNNYNISYNLNYL